MPAEIPDKIYFKIGEVASIAEVKPHVLRYWETEFSLFRPQKTRSRQRQYRRRDVELVLEIRDLLYNQGYTIAGAKKKLNGKTANNSPQTDRATLLEVRNELSELRKILE